MTVNPYASPPPLPGEAGGAIIDDVPLRPLRSLARWTLVCAISALPSFFWGCGLHHEGRHIAAMLCGIGVFVLGYAVAECTPTYQRMVRLPYVRRTLLIGYGTRLAASIIFPLGLTLDMFVGMAAVALVEGVLVGTSPAGHLEEWGPSFWVVFVTTLVQGFFLNVLLLTYMLSVYAIQWAHGRSFRVRRPILGAEPGESGTN